MPAQILPLVDTTLDFVRQQQAALAQQRVQQQNDFRQQQLDLQQQRIQQELEMNPIRQQILQAQLEQHHAATRESMFALNHAEALAPLQEEEARQRLKQGETQNRLAEQQYDFNEQEQPLQMDLRKQQLASGKQQMQRTQQEIDFAPGIYQRQNDAADAQMQAHNAQMQEALSRQLESASQLPQSARAIVLKPFLQHNQIDQESFDQLMSLPDQRKDTRDSIAMTLGELDATRFDAARERLKAPLTKDDETILKARALGGSDETLQALGKSPTSRERDMAEIENILNRRDKMLKAAIPDGKGEKLDPKTHKDLIDKFLKAAGGDPVKARQLAIENGWVP